ncbi:hypothetical protein REPUB_Repub10bG0044700 [Reevesia pubescens]
MVRRFEISVGNVAVVFVENLPEEFRSVNLLDIFTSFGKIIEAFMVRRKNKANRRFGFVKFESMVVARQAIQVMNGKMVSGKRISVNFARFDKQKKPVVSEGGNKIFEGFSYDRRRQLANSTRCMEFWHRQRRPGVSFKQALLSEDLKAVGKSVKTEGRDLQRCRGVASANIISWLQKSALVVPKHTACSQGVADLLLSSSVSHEMVRKISDRLFLVTFKDLKQIFELHRNNWVPLSDWCLKCLKWDAKESFQTRVTSVIIKGVPWHAWTFQTAANLLKNWGEPLRLSTDINKMESFDDFRVEVLVKNNIFIEEELWCDLEEGSFLVSIKEMINRGVEFSEDNASGHGRRGVVNGVVRRSIDGSEEEIEESQSCRKTASIFPRHLTAKTGTLDKGSEDNFVNNIFTPKSGFLEIVESEGSKESEDFNNSLVGLNSFKEDKMLDHAQRDSGQRIGTKTDPCKDIGSDMNGAGPFPSVPGPSFPPGFEEQSLVLENQQPQEDALAQSKALEAFSPVNDERVSKQRKVKNSSWITKKSKKNSFSRTCSSFSSSFLVGRNRNEVRKRKINKLTIKKIPNQVSSAFGGQSSQTKSLEAGFFHQEGAACTAWQSGVDSKCMEEAKEIWKVGVQLGLRATNEAKVVEHLAALVKRDKPAK